MPLQSLMGAYLDAVADVNAWVLEDMLMIEEYGLVREPSDVLRLVVLEIARDMATADLIAALDKE